MDNRFADELISRFSVVLSDATKRLENRIDGLETGIAGLRDELLEFRAATESNCDGLVRRLDAFETRFVTFESKVYLPSIQWIGVSTLSNGDWPS